MSAFVAMASGHARLRRAVSLLTYAPVAHCEGPMPFSKVTGDLPKIIANQERIYEGNLTFYFRTLFFKSSNIHNPYHNFRHMLHVLWLCHQACRYYQNRLTPRQMRNLLIAALFHDFDHPGHPHPGENDPDRVNIPIAIAGLRRYVMSADRGFLPQIEALIEATHYPYKIGSDKLDLLGQIIRDADLAQALSPAWIQQVVFGLAQEWEVSPFEVLKGQGSFLAGLSFSTCWAQQLFPQELIQAKIEEVEQLLRLLETAPASAAGD
ncbi:MAG: HD domain-containing protein [Chthoniobacterales bacterium]